MDEQGRGQGTGHLPPWPPPLPVEATAPRHPPGVPEAAARLLGRLLSPLRLLGHMTLALLYALTATVLVVASESSVRGDEMNAQTGLAFGLPMLAVVTLLLILMTRSGHRLATELTALLRTAPDAVPPMSGRRALWGTVSGAGLLIGLVCAGTATAEATVGSNGQPPDGYEALGLFSWATVAWAWSVPGLVRALRHRPPPGSRAPSPAGRVPLTKPAPPPNSYEGREHQLYANARGAAEPIAASRLSPRLSRWILTLSRGAVLTLTAVLCLVGCGLAALGAVLPRAAGDWLIWPLLAVLIAYLLLMLMELAHYGTHAGCLVLFVLAGVALVVSAWQGYQELTLRERGEWATAEIVGKRSPARGGTTCEVRLLDTSGGTTGGTTGEAAGAGRVLDQRLGGCRSLAVGDTLRVFYDPEDRVSPARGVPTLAVPTWFGGIGGSLALVAALLSVNHGHGRRRELDLLHTE